jgi:hypothetical protein
MKKNIYKALSLFVAVSFLTSCLKDDSLVLDPAKTNNVIEFANPAQIVQPGAVHPLYAFGYDILPAAEQVLEVSYSGAESGAPQDITVNLAGATGAAGEKFIADYNTDQGKNYTLLPADFFKLSTTSVIIKKGEKKASFSVFFATDKFDLSIQYVLPVQITSASSGVVSGNFGTILLSTAARNKYDGKYHSTGYFQHPVAASSRPIDRDKTLLTVNANTVSTEIGDVGGSMELSVNETTNEVTIVGQLSATQPLVPTPGKTNTYDPATKTFNLNYQYTGGGGFRVITEVIKLK